MQDTKMLYSVNHYLEVSVNNDAPISAVLYCMRDLHCVYSCTFLLILV